MVPLVSQLESVDGFTVWILHQITASQIVRTHPLSDNGLPRQIERPVVQQEAAADV